MSKIFYDYSTEGYLLNKFWRNENNELHREDGPAQIEYNKYGDVYREIYFINGEAHRYCGPAYILYVVNYCDIEVWFYNGKILTDEVNGWIKENKLTWKKMNEDDFNRMWMEIL